MEYKACVKFCLQLIKAFSFMQAFFSTSGLKT